MNLIQFTHILNNPNHIKKKNLKGLHEIVEKYPYFQAAHFLYLSGLKKQRSFKYNDQLKLTAAYSTDRTLLFDYVTAFDQDIQAAPSDLKKKKKSGEKEDAITLQKEMPSAEPEPEKDKSPEEILGVGEPLKFSPDETHSFREWLQLSHMPKVDRTPEKTEETAQKKQISKKGSEVSDNMELIDKFIATNPKISPVLSTSFSDFAQDSVIENDHLMTETLAHVYIEQKKYKKAILAFQVLSLKYPEKSSFFASRIQAIKELQDK
jgi:hypothetical protein